MSKHLPSQISCVATDKNAISVVLPTKLDLCVNSESGERTYRGFYSSINDENFAFFLKMEHLGIPVERKLIAYESGYSSSIHGSPCGMATVITGFYGEKMTPAAKRMALPWKASARFFGRLFLAVTAKWLGRPDEITGGVYLCDIFEKLPRSSQIFSFDSSLNYSRTLASNFAFPKAAALAAIKRSLVTKERMKDVFYAVTDSSSLAPVIDAEDLRASLRPTVRNG